MNCRLCGSTDLRPFVDLGHQPPSNSFLTKAQLDEPEVTYPLKLFTCASCRLVQIPEYKMAREIFKEDYPYYSSESPSNVQHAKEYVEMITGKFGLTINSQIMEIGGNDGYLLQHFPEGSKVLNIEPSFGPANVSARKGIPTITSFFSNQLSLLYKFDLICGINVLAHQPNINDFVEGIAIALKPSGICTMEFPHLYHLIKDCQFDTIYHEHYNYFSLSTILKLFGKHNLQVFDVEELPEHGGSLRIYAHKIASGTSSRVQDVLQKEWKAGLMDVESSAYFGFESRVRQIKRDLVRFIMDVPEDMSIAAYGAAAKGNTLLNYCGIKSDLIPYVADRSPHKQGKYLPGSHIKVISPEELEEYSPDYVLVLPWNIKREIMKQLEYIRDWDGKFIVPIPNVEVV